MPENGLGCLLMTAVIDPEFQERLLTSPGEVIGDFALTRDEQEVLTSIQAGSFAELAAQLCKWLEQRDPLHLGLASDNVSSDLPWDGLHYSPARTRELAGLPLTSPHAGRMLDLHPLRVEVSRAMQPRYKTDEEIELALPVNMSSTD
ncbi:MAG: hypothetical protein D6791_03580 [Chloroflexi bacterium]|nr:MAG: hypothetical protein D6791_03580 [Chloroflexota bacterium]